MTIQKSINLSFEFADICCLTSPLPPPENLCQHMSDFKTPSPSTADIICELSLMKLLQYLTPTNDERKTKYGDRAFSYKAPKI